MRTVVVAWVQESGNASEELEFIFGHVFIECATPYCKKRIDVTGTHAKAINEEFIEMSAIQIGDSLHLKNTYPAKCPYCELDTKYALEMIVKPDKIVFGNVSDNVILVECITPDGQKTYQRDNGDPTSDPNFNFAENINKGETIYFYNDDDTTDNIQTIDAHFIPEGESCIAIAEPDETGYSEDYIVNGPLAVIEDATLIISNRNKFACTEVHSKKDDELIAPCGNPNLFNKKIVLCSKNAPKWTRIRQSTTGKADE